MIIDEKFKDASPVATVERIRKILHENGLEVEETWNTNCISHCYALRIQIVGTSYGTNGKGVTKELARASAYAEMMERMQSGIIGRSNKLTYPGTKRLNREQLKQTGDVLYERMVKMIQKFDGETITEDRIIDAAFGYANATDEVEAVPFYSILDDKMVNIPRSLMVPLYSSTGMAAGNTPEEAIVQGMSEIWERWCQRHFLTQGMVPPTIPDEYLRNYPMAYETITQVRNSGYDVLVKDCSMGSGYPAIATAVIDKRTHTYHVHMGASPVFEIALGRSLTETFQGRLLEKVTDTSLSETAKDVCTYRKSYVMGRGAYPIEYFTDDATFPFVPFEDRTHCSNRELLAYAVDFFRSKGMKIYVRDMSHMGFCTYQAIISDMNHTHFQHLTSALDVPRLYGETRAVWLNMDKATEEELFLLHLLNMYRLQSVFIDKLPKGSSMLLLPVTSDRKEDYAIGYAHVAYVEWACGNHKDAYGFAQKIASLKVPGLSDYCSCLCRAKKMVGEGQSLDEALKKLALFYEQKDIEQVRTVLGENSNPFDCMIVHCGTVGENCGTCRYANSCVAVRNKQVAAIMQKYADAFDYEKSLADLKELFNGIV